MNDQLILQHLKTGDRGKAVNALYGYYPVVKMFIRKNGGTAAEAQDIFQETLLILCRKCREENFQLTSALNSYVFGISQRLWLNHYRQQQKQLQPLSNSFEESDVWIEEEEKFKKAERALSAISERCKQVLRLFYIEKKSMAELAQRFGFSSENHAKTQKYKCLEEARNHYRNH